MHVNDALLNDPNSYDSTISVQHQLITSKIWKTAQKVGRFAIAILTDILLIPFALGATLYGVCFGTNLDPKPEEVKTDKTPILFIHGNGFNETKWLIGRQFLKGAEYGSVFSLNLDGLLSNQAENGIEEYAEKVKNKLQKIKELTGREDVILIGHSMGGLVASAVRETMDIEIEIKKVITISTPWKSPPLLEKLTSLTERFFPSLFKEPKRYQNMRNEEGFLDYLKEKVSDHCENYYSIYSISDPMVPNDRGKLTDDPDHTKEYRFLGHFTPMICPSVWHQIQDWTKS